jgi:perosamine synthetase
MFYPLVLRDGGKSRADLIRYLEDRHIETRYLLPLINQPIYRSHFGDLDAQYPVAARLNQSSFYIGCHAGITNDEADHVIDTFQQFFEGRG